jgi:hypothetical protein
MPTEYEGGWRKSRYSGGGGGTDCVEVNWRKSSYSGGTGGTDCVEVAFVASEVGVRDSKNAGGPRLNFPETAWRSFVSRRAQAQARPTVPSSCG